MAVHKAFGSALISPIITQNGNSISISTGDPITATVTFQGASVGFDDGQGLYGTGNLGSDGELTADSWTNSNAGTSGHDEFNADGSRSGTVIYASGAYAITQDDGQGNITTDYYTPSGVETRSTWVHSDGNSGAVNLYQDGLTANPAGGPYSVPVTHSTVVQSPEGSYSIISYNAQDISTTITFDSLANQNSWSTGSGAGTNDLTTANSVSEYISGAESTFNYNSSGVFIGNSWYSALPDGSPNSEGIAVDWAQASCTSGSEVVDASGVIVKTATSLDGSIYRDTVERQGSTVSHYDTNELLLSDRWSLIDGSNALPSVTGSDSFSSDGSGSGSFTNLRDQTSGDVMLDASGDITITNRTASGAVSSKDIWSASRGHRTFGANSGASKPGCRMRQGSPGYSSPHTSRSSKSLIAKGFEDRTARFRTKSTMTPSYARSVTAVPCVPSSPASLTLHVDLGSSR